MAELLPFNWFQNGGRRHLGFLDYVNFDGKSVLGTPFSASVCIGSVSTLVQMRAIMAEFAQNVIFNMATAAILDFVGYEFWG